MSDFVKVADIGELSDPGKQLIEADDHLLVLFHVSGQYYCLDDVCTHDGGPLGEGELDGKSIACPRHGAKFNICTGKAETMPATEDTRSHQVQVNDDGIYVKVNDGSSSESSSTEATSNPVTTSADTRSPAAMPNPTANTETTVEGEPVSPASEESPNSTLQTDSSTAAESETLSEDVVMEQLKKVIDPELFVNIVDLGLIYTVELKEGSEGQQDVVIEMTMTSPACPAGPQLIANSRQVVGQLNGVADVEVKIVMDPPWTPDKMTDDAKDQLGIF